MGQTPVPDLGTLRGKNRVLLVFAADANTKALRVQETLVEQRREGLAERDVRCFFLTNESSAAQALRARLQVDKRTFAVVLIGKDGSVKLRRTTPIQMDELFATIDAMPMRQQEMKSNQERR